MMAGEAEPDEARFGDLVALKGVVQYPIRIKCAVLAWDVLAGGAPGRRRRHRRRLRTDPVLAPRACAP